MEMHLATKPIKEIFVLTILFQVTWQKKWEEEEGMNNLNNQ